MVALGAGGKKAALVLQHKCHLGYKRYTQILLQDFKTSMRKTCLYETLGAKLLDIEPGSVHLQNAALG